MKNDTRNDVFTRHSRTALLGRVSLCTLPCLVVNQAWADVPPPPPAYHKPIDTSFPSGKALERQGYDPKTGVLRVNVNKTGKPQVTSNGSTVTGSQNVRITATDAYGNKATMGGKITQTANTAIIGAYVGGALSQGFEKYGEQAVNDIKDGRYSDAVRSAAGGAATVINAFSGGFYGSVYKVVDKALGTNLMGNNPPANSSSADSVVGNVMGAIGKGSPAVQGSALVKAAASAAAAQSAAQTNGDIGGALGAAAVSKAAGAAAAAANAAAAAQSSAASSALSSGAKLAAASRNSDGSYSQLFLRRIDLRNQSNINPLGEVEGVGWQIDKNNGIYNWQNLESAKKTWLKAPISIPARYQAPNVGSLSVAGWKYQPITSDKELSDAQALVAGSAVAPSTPAPKPEDMTLSEGEIARILGQMFANQKANHGEMMSALSQIAANTAPQSPSTSESGGQSGEKPHSQVIKGSSPITGGPSIVDKATTGYTVSGDSAISAPYTPAGSDTPQQTQFSVNSDGTVTATAVPRT